MTERVSVEHYGKTVTARWELNGGMLTLYHPTMGSRSTHLGNMDPEQLARMLLSEIAQTST